MVKLNCNFNHAKTMPQAEKTTTKRREEIENGQKTDFLFEM